MPIFANEGMGIDLGSSKTAIFLTSESDVVLRESSSVLVRAENMRDVLSVGNEARQMSGRTGEENELVQPVRHGVIADVEQAALLMVALAEKVTGRKKPMDKATLVVGMPGGITRVELAALFQAMEATGAKKIAALRTPVAAAIGADMDISRPRGTMIVSLGSGCTEIAVLSMGSIVALRSIPFGGQDMDEAIVRWLWRHKGIVIGLRTAEQIKKELGTADEKEIAEDEEPVLLKGKDVATGKPISCQIHATDIKQALDEPVLRLVDAVRGALYNVPPELAADIKGSGIQLTGGGALLSGIRERLSRETGLPVHVSEHPQDDAVIGLGAAAGSDRLLSALIHANAAEVTSE